MNFDPALIQADTVDAGTGDVNPGRTTTVYTGWQIRHTEIFLGRIWNLLLNGKFMFWINRTSRLIFGTINPNINTGAYWYGAKTFKARIEIDTPTLNEDVIIIDIMDGKGDWDTFVIPLRCVGDPFVWTIEDKKQQVCHILWYL